MIKLRAFTLPAHYFIKTLFQNTNGACGRGVKTSRGPFCLSDAARGRGLPVRHLPAGRVRAQTGKPETQAAKLGFIALTDAAPALLVLGSSLLARDMIERRRGFDEEMLRDLLERHVAETGSTLAASLLDDFEAEADNFVRVMPRDYAAVLKTRTDAVAEGLDPDGDVVWTRILEVTGG